MSVTRKPVRSIGIRIAAVRCDTEVGHAYVYIMWNDLHQELFALLEDVAVEPSCQGQGIGNELLASAEQIVIEHLCYKWIATSRNLDTSGEDRSSVHDWYLRRGFKRWGTEFRKEY